MRRDKGPTALSASPLSLASSASPLGQGLGMHEAVSGEAEVSRLMCNSDLCLLSRVTDTSHEPSWPWFPRKSRKECAGLQAHSTLSSSGSRQQSLRP